MRGIVGINGVDGRILRDPRYAGIPPAGIPIFFRNGGVVTGFQRVPIVYLHGFQRFTIREEYDCMLRFERRIYCIDRYIVMNRCGIWLPCSAIA